MNDDSRFDGGWIEYDAEKCYSTGAYPNPELYVDIVLNNGNEYHHVRAESFKWGTVERPIIKYRVCGAQENIALQPADNWIKFDISNNDHIDKARRHLKAGGQIVHRYKNGTESTYDEHSIFDTLDITHIKYLPSVTPPRVPEALTSNTGTVIDPNSRYYDAGGIETIDVIKAKLTDEQLKGYLLGNIIKYSCRLNFKGSADRDAEKLKFYSQWLSEIK